MPSGHELKGAERGRKGAEVVSLFVEAGGVDGGDTAVLASQGDLGEEFNTGLVDLCCRSSAFLGDTSSKKGEHSTST